MKPQSPYELDKDKLIDLASVVFEIYCSLQEDDTNANITRIDSGAYNTYQEPAVFIQNRSEEDLKDMTLSVLNYLTTQGLVRQSNPLITSRPGELGPIRDITNIEVEVADRSAFFSYAQDVFKAVQPFFDNEWRRLNDFIVSGTSRNKETPAWYSAKNQQLIIGDLKIHIDPDTDQETFCKRLFPKGKPTKRPVQKAALFEVFGYYSEGMTSDQRQEASRKLYSVRTALNNKVQNQSKGKINKLFTPGDTFWISEKYR